MKITMTTQRLLPLLPLAASALVLLSIVPSAHAQPELPPPEATDPVVRGTMIGSPPAVDKRVTLANVLAYPNGRWAF
ncbi:MAG: 6-aminohexanoate hydrolase, partial [Burkholderiales bacterium]